MYTFISFSIKFEGIIFDIVFILFAQFFSFFLWNLSTYCIVIFNLITLKRLLLERPVSQLSVVKNRLEISFQVHNLQLFLAKKPKLSWTIFDNFVRLGASGGCCTSSSSPATRYRKVKNLGSLLPYFSFKTKNHSMKSTLNVPWTT